jgi:hypothetical protein
LCGVALPLLTLRLPPLPHSAPHTHTQAPIDEKTKTLLLVAVGLLTAVGAIATGKALVDSLQNRITAASGQVSKLVIGGAFWLAVFVAARAVLEL